jgi:hypothetical protein
MKAMLELSKVPTIDDFCIDESCSKEEKGKLSSHIICPMLGFNNIQEDI